MHRAGELRRELTPAERKLWGYLRGNKLDGSQHLEQEEYDLERTAYLASQGYKVIRFWNNHMINDIDVVIQAIVFALDEQI